MRRAPVTAALGALLWLAATAGCREASDGPPIRRVLLIVLDATHAAHLSCHDGPAGLTPNIDALAARGARFERAFSTAAWTLPSTASLLSGRLPEHHGVVTDEQRLPAEARLLGELLSQAGWSTAAFVQMVYASDTFGLDQGFEHYRYYATSEEKQDAHLLLDAVGWLRERASDERAFAYVHLRRPHGPYEPTPEAWRRTRPERLPLEPADVPADRRAQLIQADATIAGIDELQAGELQLVEALYRANLAAADEAVGTLLEQVDIDADTLVVLTSDHGEALGQHGVFGHGTHLWAETLDVPFIAAGPGIAAFVASDPVCTVDVFPTILEAADVAPPPGSDLDGRSLWPLLRGGRAPPRRAPIPVAARYEAGALPAVAVFDGDWKLVLDPDDGTRLFDRSADPQEREDRSADQPAIAERLAGLARAWRAQHRKAAHVSSEAPPLDEQRQRDLEALGYVR